MINAAQPKTVPAQLGRRLLGPCVAGILMISGVPALAQDAEQVGLARDMLVAMRAAENFDAVIPSVMTALKPAITAGNPKAAKDWDDLAPMMTQQFSAQKTELLNEIASIYARAFDKPELRQLVAFYHSPAGEKLARLTPTLAQETLGAGQKFGQQVAMSLAEQMKDELRKRGNKI